MVAENPDTTRPPAPAPAPGRRLRVPSPVNALVRLLGMSDEEFAAFAGISLPTARSYRYGYKHPDIMRLYELTVKAEERLGVRPTLDQLIDMAFAEARRTGHPIRQDGRRKILPALDTNGI